MSLWEVGVDRSEFADVARRAWQTIRGEVNDLPLVSIRNSESALRLLKEGASVIGWLLSTYEVTGMWHDAVATASPQYFDIPAPIFEAEAGVEFVSRVRQRKKMASSNKAQSSP